MSRGGAEKEGERISSRFCAVSIEPAVGLNSTNPQAKSRVGGFTEPP